MAYVENLKPRPPVELVDGVLEAEVALLHQIEEIHAGGEGIAAGDAHDEPEIRPDETILCCGRDPDDLFELEILVAGGEVVRTQGARLRLRGKAPAPPLR